jgi:hypothetical protein
VPLSDDGGQRGAATREQATSDFKARWLKR